MKNVLYVAAKEGSEIEVNLHEGNYSDENPWLITIDGKPVTGYTAATKEALEERIKNDKDLEDAFPYTKGKLDGIKIYKVTYNINIEEA